jgi:outer membrane protein OmpA-like peptidoglycan-associated protein
MDKSGKDTGPGKVEIDLGDIDTLSPFPLIAVDLFNYNVDGNLLKAEHKKFLDNQLIPLLKKEKAHVKLRGTASKSGGADYNRQLSLERVLRVKGYLLLGL